MLIKDLKFGKSAKGCVDDLFETRVHEFDAAFMVKFLNRDMNLIRDFVLIEASLSLHEGVQSVCNHEIGVDIGLDEISEEVDDLHSLFVFRINHELVCFLVCIF